MYHLERNATGAVLSLFGARRWGLTTHSLAVRVRRDSSRLPTPYARTVQASDGQDPQPPGESDLRIISGAQK